MYKINKILLYVFFNYMYFYQIEKLEKNNQFINLKILSKVNILDRKKST
jgi:hypothetical protein